MGGNAERDDMEVILGLAAAMQNFLDESARMELRVLVNSYREGRMSAATVRAVIEDFGRAHPGTRSSSAAQTPTSSETGTPLWATGWETTSNQSTGRSWLDVAQHMSPPVPPPYPDGLNFHFHGPPQGVYKGAGKGKGGGGQMHGFHVQQKGQVNRKGDGKGKGKKGKNKHGFHTVAAAKQALQQFLQENQEFVFRPRDGVLPEHSEVYSLTAEKDEKLYKNLTKHFKASPEEFTLFLRAMAENTHWPVDRLNDVEKNSAQKREGDVASRSSNVSRASFLSSVSTRR